MVNETYKYTLDRIIKLIEFMWLHRKGSEFVRVYRIYYAMVALAIGWWAVDFFIDSSGVWRFHLSIGSFTLLDLAIVLSLTLSLYIVLSFLCKKNFETQEIESLKRIELEQFKHSIKPLQLFDDFVETYNVHDVESDVDTDMLRKYRCSIVDYNQQNVRLLGLSGTGKTYLIKKAFSEKGNTDSVFYCNQVRHQDFFTSIQTLITKKEGATIILDNCPKSIASNVASSFGDKIRIVSVYFDPNDTDGSFKTLKMETVEKETIVNQIIDGNLVKGISPEDKQKIIKYSGNIPFMALLLVQAYNKSDSLGGIKDSLLMEHLLDIDEENKQEKRCVMRTLSLFQPLDYNDCQSKTMKYLLGSDLFTPFENASIKKELVCKKVVNKLIQRSLIEQDNIYINMRPLPLAIWLVGEWIQEQSTDFVAVINELAEQPKELFMPLIEGFAKRLEFMQDNQFAIDLYGKLVKLHGGPFATEDVVCSELGSRLILAMSTVNPVAVSECLYGLLYTKEVSFLKDNLKDEARRNVVRTLEKLCFCKESFHKSALTLARLAIAENEGWSNNSRGQFLQLFHIVLAGTESTLEERADVLKKLVGNTEYRQLVLDACSASMNTVGLSRFGGSEKFGFKELQDYSPSWEETISYWDKIYDILIGLANDEPETKIEISNIISSKARMLVNGGNINLLFKYIENLLPVLNNDWTSMHKALIDIKSYDALTADNSERLLEWIEKLSPIKVVDRMKNRVHELYTQHLQGDDIITQEENVVKPFVQEFVERKLYVTEEMDFLITNTDYISWAFTKQMAESIPSSEITSVCSYIVGFISKQEKQFSSNWLIRFAECLHAKALAIELYEKEYVPLSVSLLAVTENEEFDNLKLLLKDAPMKENGEEIIRIYQRATRLNNAEEICRMITLLKDNNASNILMLDCISQYWYRDELYENQELYKLFKDIVLDIDLEGNANISIEYVRQIEHVLQKCNDEDFAIRINQKFIDALSHNQIRYSLDEIYPLLLTKYRKAIWHDFIDALCDLEKRAGFYLQVKYSIGSGFGFDERVLFKDHEDEMRQMCEQHPQYGPLVCASLCPVFAKDNNTGKVVSFHPFVVWLIEKYGKKQQILDELHSNFGTYHWTGSVIPLLDDKKLCYEKLREVKGLSSNVYKWIDNCLEVNEKEREREKKNEAYMRMAYNFH